MENNYIAVIIRDGNRVVNWEFPPETPLTDVLAKWQKGYHQFERVWMNGAVLNEAAFGLFLSALTDGDSIRLNMVTKFPKKHREEDET